MTITATGSINQYDARYNINGFGKMRTACSFFGLLSANDFLKTGDVSIKRHNEIVDNAVANTIARGSDGSMDFKSLLKYVKNNIYTDNDILSTSYSLVKSEDVGYNFIFPKSKDNYCVLFLKNGKFFVVFVKEDGYSIRDSHETEQYDFTTFDELKNHLSEKYQFDKKIDLSGPYGEYTVDEWGSIEFIKMYDIFETTLDTKIKIVENFEHVPTESVNKRSGFKFEIMFPNDCSVGDYVKEKMDYEDDYVSQEKKQIQEDADFQLAKMLQEQEMGGDVDNSFSNKYVGSKGTDILKSVMEKMNKYNSEQNKFLLPSLDLKKKFIKKPASAGYDEGPYPEEDIINDDDELPDLEDAEEFEEMPPFIGPGSEFKQFEQISVGEIIPSQGFAEADYNSDDDDDEY